MRLWILFFFCASAPASQGAPRRKYMCPADFVRHGNSCYFFSTHMEMWFDAHFDCKDRNSELAILDKGWEDRNMRTYLNKPELARLERWIGGIYNWETKRWVWGANGGHPLKYQGFSQMPRDVDPRWNCIVMDPEKMYKWGSSSCIQKKHYICEVPLKRLQVPDPVVTTPRQPKKPRDPKRPRKPKNPNKKPKDPNRKNRDPNKKSQLSERPQRNRQHRLGRRQRQHVRQQQATTTQKPEQKLEPQHQYQPINQHTRVFPNRYKYLHIKPELVLYNAEVLL